MIIQNLKYCELGGKQTLVFLHIPHTENFVKQLYSKKKKNTTKKGKLVMVQAMPSQ